MESAVKQLPEVEVARNYIALSREFQEQQLYGKAESTLFLALDRLPNHPFILARLAKLYLKLEMPEKALDILNRLIRHHADLSFPYFLRGKLRESLNEIKLAIMDYQRALTGDEKDDAILKRLVPLLIQHGKPKEALQQVEQFQDRFGKSHKFAEFQAEALLVLGEVTPAFNKMREVLMQNPQDKRVIKKYLGFTIRSSERNPTEIFQFLKFTVPKLAALETKELAELEIDFFTMHQNYKAALLEIDKLLEEFPTDHNWRKRRALIMLEMGNIKESVTELKELFLKDPADREIRDILENYYLVTGQQGSWKELVQEVLSGHADYLELANSLRCIGKNRDWLEFCKLENAEFMKQVERLNLVKSDLNDITFEKLPHYALETFISQVAIHNYLANPADLWLLISGELKKKNQVLPFQLEDIEAAYPVWVFALHIYFLFKSYSDYKLLFTPAALQNDKIAVTLLKGNSPIQVDLASLIGETNPRLKPLVKSAKGLRWRLRFENPEEMFHEIHFYSAEQFKQIVMQLETLVVQQNN